MGHRLMWKGRMCLSCNQTFRLKGYSVLPSTFPGPYSVDINIAFMFRYSSYVVYYFARELGNNFNDEDLQVLTHSSSKRSLP